MLQRRRHDLLGRLPETGVDDLHPRIAQRPRNHLRTSIVPIQPRLRDDDSQFLHGLIPNPESRQATPHAYITGTSSYSPHTSRSASHISPTVAYARAASMISGIRCSVVLAAVRSVSSDRRTASL